MIDRKEALHLSAMQQWCVVIAQVVLASHTIFSMIGQY